MVRFGLTVGLTVFILALIALASYAPESEVHRRSTYFKPGQLRADPEADAMYDEFLSAQLEKMHLPNSREPMQPSLFVRPASPPKHEQEYRAIISQGHEYIIAVRAYHDTGGNAEVAANKVNLVTGESKAIKKQLNGTEWGDILHNIDKAGMFNAHHAASYAGDCPDWIIEAREGERYEMMSLSCTKDPATKELQEAFQRAAGSWAY
jgi:hypothetical protein